MMMEMNSMSSTMMTEQEPHLSRRSRDDHTDHERIPLKLLNKDLESLEISATTMTTHTSVEQHEQSIGPYIYSHIDSITDSLSFA